MSKKDLSISVKKSEMIDQELEQEPEVQGKLYSSNAIFGATFLGGPVVGGYLIGSNFKAMGKTSLGTQTMVVGVLITIFLFTALFFLPEEIMNSLPRMVIPLLFCGAAYWFVQAKQGKVLKALKGEKDVFYPHLRGIGIGLGAGVITVGILLSPSLVQGVGSSNPEFDKRMSQFYQNESNTLGFYQQLDKLSDKDLLTELDFKVIPAWEENLDLMNEIRAMKNLPDEIRKENDILHRYTELRIHGFSLIRKSLAEKTYAYRVQIQKTHQAIDAQIELLSKLAQEK